MPIAALKILAHIGNGHGRASKSHPWHSLKDHRCSYFVLVVARVKWIREVIDFKRIIEKRP
jgi:hypothetical protein